MMMPSIFNDNFMDDFMNFSFNNDFFKRSTPTMFHSANASVMKTDVKETEQGYEVQMELPGVKKEDISAKLDQGYLTVRVTRDANNEEKDDNGKFIRRERFYGNMSRKFYVGDAVEQEDIKAKFENGILSLTVPKKEVKEVEDTHTIAIEG